MERLTGFEVTEQLVRSCNRYIVDDMIGGVYKEPIGVRENRRTGKRYCYFIQPEDILIDDEICMFRSDEIIIKGEPRCRLV